MSQKEERKGRPLAEMRGLAERFIYMIEGRADRTMICGSIRRQKPEPKDIDIVAIPRYEKVSRETAFGFSMTATENLLKTGVDQMIVEGLAKPRIKIDGTTMVGDAVAFLEFEGVALDIYYATPETWWGLVQMRTGSAQFNARLATYALNLGLRYHGDGKGITKTDGHGGDIRIDDGLSEESIMKAVGINYVPPEKRD